MPVTEMTNEREQDNQPTMMPGRRQMLAGMGAATAAMFAGPALAAGRMPVSPLLSPSKLGWDAQANEYTLPDLPYGYDALEPHIDEQTMRLHHDIHHAGYVRGLNTALARLAEIREGSRDTSETKHWSRQLAFHGSGHVLHVTFWNCMSPNGGGEPRGQLKEIMDRDFGSFAGFARQFQAAASSVEGSGWGLVGWEPMGERLVIMQAEKHQNLTTWGVYPLIAIDVWEHAYYLKYQNRRSEYVQAFMNVINWSGINNLLQR